MKYDFDVNDKWKVNAKLEIENKEKQEIYKKILNDFKKNANIPGFRAGKAPVAIVEKKYKNDIESQTISDLINKKIDEFLKKEKFHIIGSPMVTDIKTEEESIKVNIEFEIFPDIKLEGYKNIEIDIEKKEVTDKLIDENIDVLRKMYAELKDYDGELKENDIAICDIFIFDEDGKELEELRSVDYSIEIGSNYVFKEISDNLIGKKKGDRIEFDFTYPEELEDELLKGKKVKFRVDIKDTKTKQMPELNEEFVKKFYLNNVEQLKEATKARLENEFQKDFDLMKSKMIIDFIIEKNKFEVPEILISAHYKSLLEQYKIKEEDINEKIKEEYRKLAEWRAKREIIYSTLITQENMKLEKDELQEEIEKIKKQKNAKSLEMLKDPSFINELGYDLLYKKVSKFLNDKTIVKTMENKGE